MQPNRALDASVALARAPGLAAAMRSQALPAGVSLLLRFLAGERQAIQEACEATGLSEEPLRQSIELFVLQVMLFRGASARRILGVVDATGRPEIRSNMRCLMLWLHPDRNSGDWQAAFAARVISAWRDVNASETNSAPLHSSDSGLADALRADVDHAHFKRRPSRSFRRPRSRSPSLLLIALTLLACMAILSAASYDSNRGGSIARPFGRR